MHLIDGKFESFHTPSPSIKISELKFGERVQISNRLMQTNKRFKNKRILNFFVEKFCRNVNRVNYLIF